MADGRVEIDARINNTNIRKDVEETNRELQRVGENMGQAGRQATKQMSQDLTDMSNSAKNAYQSMTNHANSSANAMQQAANTATEASKQTAAQRYAEAEANRQMAQATQEASNTVVNSYRQQQQEYAAMYSKMSESQRTMANEMKTFYMQQSMGMLEHKAKLMEVEYGYFQLNKAAQTYQGTTQAFMNDVKNLGAQYKAASDTMINSDIRVRQSMMQTAGTMLNMSTQASKISDNYTRMQNTMYMVNKGGLAIADSMNKVANSGNAAVLALSLLGPTASMKQLVDMQNMINQGYMRFQMVALSAAVSSYVLYGALHKTNMEMNPQYAEAFTNMINKLREAFQPMVDAFAAMMIPMYNFIAGVAEMVIQFNQAHPTLAMFIQGAMMLVPALTLLLSPLAVGVGLLAGFKAAMFAVWSVIAPLVTGLMAMSATVWVVAAAIAGLALGFTYLWNNSETFKNGVIAGWEAIKTAAQTVYTFIKDTVIVPIMTAISTFVLSILNQIKAFWDTNGEQIKTAATNAWNGIVTIISGVMAVLGPILQVAWECETFVYKCCISTKLRG